jgi:hypothetical protein
VGPSSAFLGSPVSDSGCHLTMAARRTSSGVLRGRGQRQHEVLQAIAQVVVFVYHPLANVPSEQLLS